MPGCKRAHEWESICLAVIIPYILKHERARREY